MHTALPELPSWPPETGGTGGTATKNMTLYFIKSILRHVGIESDTRSSYAYGKLYHADAQAPAVDRQTVKEKGGR